MKDTYFFGYGSLVNAATHDYAPVHRARIRGWTRAWVATPDRRLCYLTAVPDADAEISGLIAPVPGESWADLDTREAAYARHDQTGAVTHDSPARSIVIYAIAPDRRGAPGSDNPILLSYLDTVIAGYLAVFGQSGAEDFFMTTKGWSAPVLDDRAAPQYSRATPLRPEVRTLVDAGLAQVGSRRLTA